MPRSPIVLDLSDNGGEFNNENFRQMCEAMNIRVMTTAAESPWSNGMCERHNAILSEMLNKILANEEINLELAICWAINAKNTLANMQGFSPYQLVFGRQPNLPGVLVDKPPALCEKSRQEVFADILDAMISARKAFLEAESSEKVKRALCNNLRLDSAKKFTTGDKVYYKRNDTRKWKGPGIVLGHDSQQILIKHGGIYVRVHPCRVMQDRDEGLAEINRKKENINESNNEESQSEKSNEDNSEVSCEEENDENFYDCNVPSNEEAISETRNQNKRKTSTLLNTENSKRSKISSIALKKGKIIRFKLPNEDWQTGRVSNRTGKVGRHGQGKYKMFWNIENLSDGNINEYDFEKDIEDWQEIDKSDENIEPMNDKVEEIQNEVLINSLCEENDIAKSEEIKKWQDENVYEEINDEGQSTLSVRWVITQKLCEGQVKVKARLVVRGFEEKEEIKGDSPTCMKESVRWALCIAASNGWSVNTMDIKAAFLQGNDIDRIIYIKPPKEFRVKGKIWRLKKAVYGLGDASRKWYLTINKVLLEIGGKCSKYDKAMYNFFQNDVLEGFVIIHVDDFLWAGSKNFQKNIICKIKSHFKISKEESEAFSSIGLKLKQERNKISIDQWNYIESLKEYKFTKEQTENQAREANDGEILEFRSYVGRIGWATGYTRPDLAFHYCEFSTIQDKPLVSDFKKINKVIRDLKSFKVSISFKPLLEENIKVSVFCDASYASLTRGGSQIGHIIFIHDDENYVPISWSSKRAKRVVRSTLSAETLAAIEGIEASEVLVALINETLISEIQQINLYTDSKSLYEAAQTTNLVTDKGLRIDMASLREKIENEKVKINWVASNNQLADVLTKRNGCKLKLLNLLESNKLDLDM